MDSIPASCTDSGSHAGQTLRFDPGSRPVQIQSTLAQYGQNKSGASSAAKNPVWQEEESPGMNPRTGKSTREIYLSVVWINPTLA